MNKNKKTDVNTVDKYGETALIRESRRGELTQVKALVEQGAILDSADNDGATALLYAARYGYMAVVRFLIESGSKLNHADSNGYTALMWASCEGHKDIVIKLIEAGADVNSASSNGRTTLMWEILNNHTDIAKLLIENGANINAADKSGETPLMIATRKHNSELVKILVDKGVKIHATDNEGLTALMRACIIGKEDNRALTSAKFLNKHVQIAMITKDILQGRLQLYRMFVHNDLVNAPLTDEYVKDCTNNFAEDLEVGKGAFGAVYIGKDKEDEKIQFVVKRPQIVISSTKAISKMKELFNRDIAALTRCRHPNIARLYGYWINEFTRNDAFFVFESLPNGSLENALCHDETRRELTGKKRVKILYEVARALLFLHKGTITDEVDKYTFVHRDIKSANIYLSADYTAKLMDCGLSKFITDPEPSDSVSSNAEVTFAPIDETNIVGTSGYVCPAYASHQILTFEPACDVYSFGIVMFEIITGWLQFGRSNWRSCDQNLVRKYHDKDLLVGDMDRAAGDGWKLVIDDLSLLALSCVSLDIIERPKTEDLLEKISEIYTRLVLSSTPVSSPSSFSNGEP